MSANDERRIERDSLGERAVPAHALYGVQTQRAVENFPISGQPMPARLVRAVALIKRAAAEVNADLGVLDRPRALAIAEAAQRIVAGEHADQFPVDVYQTGSGTSTNMNVNEVVARLAADRSGLAIHPNDHVNRCQSSNDTMPTAIHLAVVEALDTELTPALGHLAETIAERAALLDHVVKTGRTHLMDAMPVTMGQEFRAWEGQVRAALERLGTRREALLAVPQGGTAVGTGVMAHPEFARRIAERLSELTRRPVRPLADPSLGIGSQEALVDASGGLKTYAVALMKIANDLRWMNSGPSAGLAEIQLPALQPGSSIMPGKVNPVLPEAACMVAAQVIGLDSANTVAGQSGAFQLNVMLPLLGHNLLHACTLLANVSRRLADDVIAGLAVDQDRVQEPLLRNPILVTAIVPLVGYEQAAAIAKRAYAENRAVAEIAAEVTGRPLSELAPLLDPRRLTQPEWPNPDAD